MKNEDFKISSLAFIDVYEREVERATKRNILKLTNDRIIKLSHDKICAMLNSKKQDDNKYLSFKVYKEFVDEQIEIKKEKIRLKEEQKKLEEEEKKVLDTVQSKH